MPNSEWSEHRHIITTIEVVDTHESYGFFGKVVAKSDVTGLSDQEIAEESDYLSHTFAECSLRYIEEVPAA